jgi:hypothetical protein
LFAVTFGRRFAARIKARQNIWLELVPEQGIHEDCDRSRSPIRIVIDVQHEPIGMIDCGMQRALPEPVPRLYNRKAHFDEVDVFETIHVFGERELCFVGQRVSRRRADD